MNLDKVEVDMLGTCKKVTISKDDTVILDGVCDKKAIEERCDLLRSSIENSTSDYDKEKLQERLPKLSGGVAVLKMGDEWDDSLQSKEKIVASLTSKQEAAIRRERALAYAFSHQWKNNSRSTNPMFMDPNNPHWGWSWLERWMVARPWERRSTNDREMVGESSVYLSLDLIYLE